MRVIDEKVYFGGKPTPGIAYVEPIEIEANYETREVAMRAGRDYVYKGLEPVGTTITCSLYDDQDLADCREFIAYVRPSIDNANTVTTWDVQHISLGGVSEFIIKKLRYPRPEKSGVYTFLIEIAEFRPPEAALKKVTGDGKIAPYSAITATGEAVDASDTDLSSAEQSASLDDQQRRRAAAQKQLEMARDMY